MAKSTATSPPAGNPAETPPADEAAPEPGTATDQAAGTPAQGSPAVATQGTTAAVAAAQPEQQVEMTPPSFWMRDIPTGQFFAAYGLGGRQELEANGCERVAEGPPDQPAAIGIPELGIEP